MESMDDRNEKSVRMSVPQFGDWDHQEDMPNYSVDFSKIREMRKQKKTDFLKASLGNEEELFHDHHHRRRIFRSPLRPRSHTLRLPITRKKILSYFNCCIKT